MKDNDTKDLFDTDLSWFWKDDEEELEILSDYIDITAWEDEEEFEKFTKHGRRKEEL